MGRVRDSWKIGIVKASAEDVVHFIYAVDGESSGDVWIKVHSDRIAPHKSKTQNEATLLYQTLQRYLEAHQ